MESSHIWMEWLKQSYRECEMPDEGPEPKRVKFSDIHESLMAQFPSDVISKQMASHAIQEAFPNAQKQRFRREKNTYMIGMLPNTPQQPAGVPQAQLTETVHLRELQGQNQQLTRQFTNWKGKFVSLKGRHHSELRWTL